MAARHFIGESSSFVSQSVLRTMGSSCASEGSAAFLRRSAVARQANWTTAPRHSSTMSAPARGRSEPRLSNAERNPGYVGAYMLLSRLPTILPTPTPFESAYYAYNAKLHRALEQKFQRELYYKKGSAAETQFLIDEAERKEVIEGAWQIETADKKEEPAAGARQRVPVPQPVEDVEEASGALLGSAGPNKVPYAFGIPMNGLKDQAIAPRVTKADEENDVLSLERKLDRTLFLVVKGASAGPSWTLPFSRLPKASSFEEQLHKVTPKSVHDLLGPNLDIWMVSNVPVGVFGDAADKPVTPTSTSESNYVMRAHILAGTPEPVEKDVEYAWLTQEELQERLDKNLWTGVEDLLSV